jgi:plasmid stabilization system protein ParE
VPASKFRLHPAVESDLAEAAEWYETQREGLGLDFLASVRYRISLILENPQRWRSVKGTRRALMSRFPYAIVYREITLDEIEIVAVAHFKRHPKYWASR